MVIGTDCKSVGFFRWRFESVPPQNKTGNSSSMVEHSIVVGDTSVRFCGFALKIKD
jgi:hypothetical protein